jgi:hypothetical protein
LVVRDSAGNYYALTPEVLELARVPDEQVTALMAWLQGNAAEETRGYLLSSFPTMTPDTPGADISVTGTEARPNAAPSRFDPYKGFKFRP